MMKINVLEHMIGKEFVSVVATEDEILFTEKNGNYYKMYHDQDCCESVTIDDINGNLDDLVGSMILVAEERSSGTQNKDEDDSDTETWTFYIFRTEKGTVDIKWYGTSNGYYSERVDILYVRTDEEDNNDWINCKW